MAVALDNETRYRIAVVALFAAMLVLRVGSMRHADLTLDEAGAHFGYGWQILHGDARRFDADMMPITVINTVPKAIADMLRPGPLRRRLEKVKTGRYITIAFALVLGAVVLRWTRMLYGRAGALLALTLYTFDPTLIGHSALVTTDVYATGAATLSLYAYWRYLEEGGLRRAISAALLFGLAQVTKYTCVFLIPIFVAIAVGRALPEVLATRRFSGFRGHLARSCMVGLLFAVASIAVTNVFFAFDQTFTPLRAYQFRSELFRSAQTALGWFGAVPVPIPYAYLDGLDWSAKLERTGHYTNIYLLGRLDGPNGWHGFKSYYFLVGLFKVPIAIQIIIVAAFLHFARRFRRFDFWRHEWVLLCPVLFYAIYLNFFFRLNIGFRHILLIFPPLYIFSGSLLAELREVPRWARVSLGALLVYLIVSVVSYFPHYIPYFNELVWDRKQAYRIAVDSNLDWGQGRAAVAQWLKQHPEAVFEPDQPMAGTIVVGANALVGINPYEQFRWLRENFTPVAHVAHAYLVFRITPQDLERITRRPADAPPGIAPSP